MKRYLVTGGAGFIGYHLSKNIADAGHHVVVSDNLFRGVSDEEFGVLIARPNVEFVNADLTNPAELSKLKGPFDGIYHLAAVNGTRNFYEIPDVVMRVNILTTINLLDWYIKQPWAKSSRFLLTSSSETYAGTMRTFGIPIPTPETVALSIEDVFNSRWSYGGSKIACELLVINYCRRHNVPFTIIRYHNIYGPRMGFDHVMPEFCKRIIDGVDPFPIFGGSETRSFCYIDDGVHATRLALESHATNGQLLHIGNMEGEVSIIDFAKRLCAVAGVSPRFDIKQAPDGSVQRRCPDTRALSALTGYKPTVSLDDGLKKSFAWYKAYYESKKQAKV